MFRRCDLRKYGHLLASAFGVWGITPHKRARVWKKGLLAVGGDIDPGMSPSGRRREALLRFLTVSHFLTLISSNAVWGHFRAPEGAATAWGMNSLKLRCLHERFPRLFFVWVEFGRPLTVTARLKPYPGFLILPKNLLEFINLDADRFCKRTRAKHESDFLPTRPQMERLLLRPRHVYLNLQTANYQALRIKSVRQPVAQRIVELSCQGGPFPCWHKFLKYPVAFLLFAGSHRGKNLTATPDQ